MVVNSHVGSSGEFCCAGSIFLNKFFTSDELPEYLFDDNQI